MAQYLDTVWRFALILALAAGGLRVIDAVPQAVTGLPRGVVRIASLDELSRRDGASLPMPAYFPSHIEWPPRDIRMFSGGSASATAWHREKREPWLTVARSAAGRMRVDAAVLPAVTLLQDTEMMLEGTATRVQRVQDGSGALWVQATWQDDERIALVRYRGPLDELLRISASLQRRSRR